MSDLERVREDLVAEQRDLDHLVSFLTPDQWLVATPSPGWDVGDQIGHLTYFDGTAALAISEPALFASGMSELFEEAAKVGYDQFILGSFRTMSPVERLEIWRMNRHRLTAAAATLEANTRVEWYGPSMGATSFLTARLMEAWAHGTDVADALGAQRRPTERLRHIAQLGFITRGWSYKVRGLEVPTGDVRLSLTGPAGDQWQWGPAGATETVTGPAEDFCLVVTQRRHLEDTSLVASPFARDWLLRAQAFAGGPTNGPAPRGR